MSCLNAQRASRLAARASRLRADGTRGFLARRAWRSLTGAACQGSQQAADALWQIWLRDPDEGVWQAMSAGCNAARLDEDACRAAMDPGIPDGQRAAIGRFCAGHGLAPADEIQRALFYVLTGQSEQHAADDPDGARLATGYQGAAEPTRALLRQAMAGHGNLDLARVLGVRGAVCAGQRTPRPLAAEEARYLVGQYAGRRDWPALWQLTLDLPVEAAVQAARLLGDEWRPAGDRPAALLRLLADADPSAIARARRELAEPAISYMRLRIDGWTVQGSFSPSSAQLLLTTRGSEGQSGCQVLDLPHGAVSELHQFPRGWLPMGAVHLGEAFYVAGRAEPGRFELVRYAAGERAVVDRCSAPITLLRHPAGFVSQTQYAGRPLLRLCDWRGQVVSEIRSPEHDTRLVTVDPYTGRLVLRGSRLWLLDGDGTRPPAALQAIGTDLIESSRGPGIVFPGPGRIAALHPNGSAEVFRITREGVLSDRVRLTGQPGYRFCVPMRGEVAVLRVDTLMYLAAGTLAPVQQQRPLAGSTGEQLWASADGRCLALCTQRSGAAFADVVWGFDAEVADLAGRPMAEMSVADLPAMKGAARYHMPASRARAFLELLARCLEYRFEGDIGLAEAAQAQGASDDVGIAGRATRPLVDAGDE